MLQLREMSRAAEASVRAGGGGTELGVAADEALERFRTERRALAESRGGVARFAESLDRAIRTDAREHLDDPSFPEAKRLAVIRGVHMMNVMTFSYGRFLRLLEPTLRAVAAREGRPARLLELGSGGGGFALELAARAAREKIPVVVEGSDVAPIYVDAANRAAKRRGVDVAFRRVDALDTSDIAKGAYDVVFIAQSLHHFAPGEVARMVAAASRIATTAFVGIDGYRSLGMLAFVGGTAALSFMPWIIHDAVVTARKFYSEADLALLARAGAPSARVSLRRSGWINTVLEVCFDGDETRKGAAS